VVLERWSLLTNNKADRRFFVYGFEKAVVDNISHHADAVLQVDLR
jgi:hypothetical protein